MTKNRKLILDIIKNSKGHLTADEIMTIARMEHPSIAKGTIYRNLGLMTDEGLLRKVSVIGGPDHYDCRTDPHQHMVCAKCGSITDVTFGNNIKERIEQIVGTDILSFDMQINYICPDCRSK
jgi:Fe2+/Zn2+ uptake regulation proteins